MTEIYGSTKRQLCGNICILMRRYSDQRRLPRSQRQATFGFKEETSWKAISVTWATTISPFCSILSAGLANVAAPVEILSVENLPHHRVFTRSFPMQYTRFLIPPYQYDPPTPRTTDLPSIQRLRYASGRSHDSAPAYAFVPSTWLSCSYRSYFALPPMAEETESRGPHPMTRIRPYSMQCFRTTVPLYESMLSLPFSDSTAYRTCIMAPTDNRYHLSCSRLLSNKLDNGFRTQ